MLVSSAHARMGPTSQQRSVRTVIVTDQAHLNTALLHVRAILTACCTCGLNF